MLFLFLYMHKIDCNGVEAMEASIKETVKKKNKQTKKKLN